ncbi:MAG TPA: hypothetical protein VK894_05680 [Jiangellales bacterium]|nr:hypothetical protein [Jiangellales bacterium]
MTRHEQRTAALRSCVFGTHSNPIAGARVSTAAWRRAVDGAPAPCRAAGMPGEDDVCQQHLHAEPAEA